MGEIERKEFFDKQLEHSKAKLSLLKKYATVWMRKVTLGTIQKKCAIIDTFAGTGYYEDGSEGSPIILIKEAMDYCEQASKQSNINFEQVILVFVEKNKENFTKLKANIEKFVHQEIKPDDFNVLNSHEKVSICITNDDFENFIKNLLDNVSSIIPTLMFIDPFGYKVIGFDNISKIIEQYSYCELIINFMYEEINRFFLAEGNEALIKTYKNFYGPNLDDIKKQIKNKKPLERRDIIINGYKENLKSKGAEYILDFDIEKNGKVKMNIIFCTKNLYGFDVMKEQMQQVCNNVNFEYHTINPQMSLFDQDDENSLIDSMSKYLFLNFTGKTVKFRTIKEKARMHPFLPSKYVKKALKKLEEKQLITNIRKSDGSKRRLYSFPEGVIIEFTKGDYDEID